MLELKKDFAGNYLPVRKKTKRVCTPEELAFFFRNCFALRERKYKTILLLQLGCECRIGEAVAVNLNDFHKDSNFRELDMLLQKKVSRIKQKDGTIKLVGQNVIEHKIMPEAIAAYVRAWIRDNWHTINYYNGYIFPPHPNKKKGHISPTAVEGWFNKKREQLINLFPNKGFDKVIGYAIYKDKNFMGKHLGNKRERRFLWSSHMLKRFAGSYSYLLTKDMKFTQQLLGHKEMRTTEMHYVQNFNFTDRARELKNKMFDISFYESIKHENDKVPAVWDKLKQLKTI